MPSKSKTTTNGFEYQSENVFGHWSWYFRPTGGPTLFISAPGPKTAFLDFLAATEQAMAFYQERLAKTADVAAAQSRVERLEAALLATKSPSWDPGGSTNNPGKVERALRSAAGLPAEIESAKREVDLARRLSDELQAHPFDADAWLKQWS